MIKSILLFGLLSCLSSYAQVKATGSSDLAELKIKMVYFNRDAFLKPCVASPSPCGFMATDVAATNDLLLKSTQFLGLDIASAMVSPVLFKKDSKGAFPLYVSEGKLGSRILVNRDRLLEVPFKTGASFEIFVESMLSYLFFQQASKLEPGQILAKKVAMFWGKLFKTIGLKELKEDKVELLVFKNNEVRLLLLDSYQAYILNPELLKVLKCDEGYVASVITSYSNIAWTQYQASVLGSKGGFRAIISYQCVNAKSEKQMWGADLSAELEFLGVEKRKWNETALLVKLNGAKKEAKQ